MRPLLAIILWAGCVCAQPGIEVPSAGAIVDSSGALRPVQGVAGSFLLGPATVSPGLSATCSKDLCLVKTNSKILSATGETDAPAGPAIFGLSGDEAIVFFPETHGFGRWHNDVLDPLGWIVGGEVLSIRAHGKEAEIAIRRNGGVSVVHLDGSVVDSIPDASGPLLLLPKGVVFATKEEIVLRQNDSEVRFALTGAESITAMGPHYAAIYVGSRPGAAVYALSIEPGRESLFLLPGTAP